MRRIAIFLMFAAAVAAACGSSAASSSPAATPAVPTPTAVVAAATPTTATPAAATPAASSMAASAPATGATAGGSPASPAACSLLTTPEAAAALGVPVNAGAPAVDPSENVCSFGGTALADMTKFVEVEVVNPVEFTPTRASVPGTFEISPASGVGDAAYYQKDILPNNSGTRWSLSVMKGATVIRLDIVSPGASDAQIKAAEMALATAAVTKF